MSNVTITGMSIPNTQIPLGPDKTGVCGVTNASTTVTFATALSKVYRGKGGFLIKLHTTIHYVSHVAADGLSLVTTTNYVGSTDASATYVIYPCLELRFYCDTPFQPVGASYVVQASPIGSPNFFKSALVSQYDAGTGDLLWMPDIVLPATGDIASPPQQKAKYFPVFYTLQGNQVAFLGGFEKGLRIPETPSSTNWPDLLIAQQTQPYNFLNEASTLSSDQVLALISSAAAIDGTHRTLLMAASGGVAAEDSALSQDVSGNLIAAGDLSLGSDLSAAGAGNFGGDLQGAVPSYTIATLPVANATRLRNRVVVSDGNRGERICRETSTGVYKWVPVDARYNIKDFGAVGDGSTNDTVAIRAAIDQANTDGGGEVYVPFGTYILTPTLTSAWEGGATMYHCFTLRSNVSIVAEKGATFKIANSVSTDLSPKIMSMFFTNSTLSNITFKGLTMDMNGANNPISPSRPASYNRYTQAHIMVSGTPGGVAARIDNAIIDECSFINSPGVSCIVMAQSNTLSVTLGKNWKVLNCTFSENGSDTDDHSSIFGWADDVIVENSTFTNSTAFGTVGSAGGNTAYEVHGSNHRFTKNKILNYNQGVWVSSNYTSTVRGTIIADNEFRTIFFGVNFFRTVATLTAMEETIIRDNIFIFDDTAVAATPALDFKAAVVIASEYEQGFVTISRNKIYKTGTAIASGFLNLSSATVAGQKHTNITVENNEGRGTTFGTLVRTNATTGLGIVIIRGNKWKDLTPAGIFAISGGDVISPTAGGTAIDSLTLGGGSVIDTRGTSETTYGTFIESTATITQLTIEPSTLKNILTAEYTDSGATITTKRGLNVISQTTSAPVYLDSSRNLVAMTGATISGGNISTIAGTPSFTGNFATIGTPSASAGLGGNWRYRDDTGTTRWLTGVLGAPAATSFSVYDVVNSKEPFSVATNSPTGSLAISTTTVGVGTPLVMTGTPQTLTGPGAVNLTTHTTLVVTTGADALTLAAGAEGQFKFIRMKTDGGDATITVTNLEGATTIVMDSAGQSVYLLYQDAKWNVLANNGCTIT